jgi:hypothetical protein
MHAEGHRCQTRDIRSVSLQSSIPSKSWTILRKSGATPRFWNAVQKSELLANPIWESLVDANDSKWRDDIIGPIFAMTSIEAGASATFLLKVMEGWLTGMTYVEIAQICKCEVGDVLTTMCDEIGFRLQDSVAKLTQLALAQRGEDAMSETAQAWPSLLQFGLGTLQQLDLFELGATDRLAVWGIQRYLTTEGIELRGSRLVRQLRRNSAALRITLAADRRVPRLCAYRIALELRLP